MLFWYWKDLYISIPFTNRQSSLSPLTPGSVFSGVFTKLVQSTYQSFHYIDYVKNQINKYTENGSSRRNCHFHSSIAQFFKKPELELLDNKCVHICYIDAAVNVSVYSNFFVKSIFVMTAAYTHVSSV